MVGDAYGLMEAAFEAVAAVARAQTLDAMVQGLTPPLARMGFERICGIVVRPVTGGVRIAKHMFGAPQDHWIDPAHAAGRALQASMVRRASRSQEAFFWSELPGQTLQKGLDQALGLHDVFTVPEHRPDGEIGAVHLVSFKEGAHDPWRRAAGQLLGIHCNAAVQRLARPASAEATSFALSTRQLECLRWTRDGKSAADIADILKLSPRTVEDHLAAACQRLGVRTRVQAVAVAIRGNVLA